MNEVRISTKKKKLLKNLTEITELKNTITELKYSLKGFNSTHDQAEDRISKPEDQSCEIIK